MEKSNWSPMKRKHLFSALESESENRDPNRPGSFIYDGVLCLAVEWLIQHLKDEVGAGKEPRVLVGDSDALPTHGLENLFRNQAVTRRVDSRTYLMRQLESTIFKGTGMNIIYSSATEYIDYLQSTFDRVVLTHNYCDYHYVLFDITYKPRDGGRPYVKVWDALDVWSQIDFRNMPQTEVISSSFFHEGQEFDLIPSRADRDPNQEGTEACAAFAFFTLAHLALGVRPPPR